MEVQTIEIQVDIETVLDVLVSSKFYTAGCNWYLFFFFPDYDHKSSLIAIRLACGIYRSQIYVNKLSIWFDMNMIRSLVIDFVDI